MLAEKEVLLTAQARNNRLYHLINEKWSRCGKPNVAAFSRDIGVDEGMAGKLLNLRMFPIGEEGSRHVGQYIPAARKIADYFDLPVEYLFPLDLYRRVAQPCIAREISLAQLPYVERMMIGNVSGRDAPVFQSLIFTGGASDES